MLIARSVHPLPGEAEIKERLLALVDGFSSRRASDITDPVEVVSSIFVKSSLVGLKIANRSENEARSPRLALAGRTR